MKLGIGDMARLRAYRDTLERNGHNSTEFVANITQTSGVFGHLTKVIPCLLRRSKVYSFRHERVMTGMEAVCMMFGGTVPSFAENDNFKDAFLRSAAGNGVHVPCVLALL
eukprot:9084480-Lingulodinium_polyedra.AAC.1